MLDGYSQLTKEYLDSSELAVSRAREEIEGIEGRIKAAVGDFLGRWSPFARLMRRSLRQKLQTEMEAYYRVAEYARRYRREIEAIGRCEEWSAEEIARRFDEVSKEKQAIEKGREGFRGKPDALQAVVASGAGWLSDERVRLLDQALAELRELRRRAASQDGERLGS